MKKVLYVIGLSHSGSTAFGMQLADRLGGIAIGESIRVFSKRGSPGENMQSICSCGKSLLECPFWGTFMTRFGDRCMEEGQLVPAERFEELYTDLLSVADAVGTELIIDMSKKLDLIPTLRALATRGALEYKVLFLVRDARGWALSDQAARARRNDTKLSLARHLHAWRSSNRHIESALRAEDETFMTVGYEEFVFDPAAVLSRIRAFAGLPAEVHTKVGVHHVAYSNRMKVGPHAHEMHYDARWMTSWSVNALALFIPGILAEIRRLVFSSSVGSSKRDV